LATSESLSSVKKKNESPWPFIANLNKKNQTAGGRKGGMFPWTGRKTKTPMQGAERKEAKKKNRSARLQASSDQGKEVEISRTQKPQNLPPNPQKPRQCDVLRGRRWGQKSTHSLPVGEERRGQATKSPRLRGKNRGVTLRGAGGVPNRGVLPRLAELSPSSAFSRY